MNRIDKLLEMLQTMPEDTFLLYALALEYSANKQPFEAEKYFIKTHETDPDYLPLYYQYGMHLIQTKSSKATEIIQQGIELATIKKDGKTKGELEFLLEDITTE